MSNIRLSMPAHRSRRGISLIEVLMSIFIISIGIMGVASLIPLAHYLANRGATADRAAAAGQAALREFKARGMVNLLAWRSTTGTNFTSDDTAAKKFCLDPRGVARGQTVFPTGGTITMPRITLSNGINLATTGAANNMLLAQADEAFSLQDDLGFSLNDNDPNALPTQIMEGTSEKRFAARDFSWLATLVREQVGDQYTLSVAVVQSRNGPDAAAFNALETEVDVTFLGGGIGGGDVRLTGGGVLLQSLAPGHWIMISEGTRARWYRVVTISEVVGSDREATLAGRDWDVTGTPKAAILANVIGVYERTIRLKTNSMWQP